MKRIVSIFLWFSGSPFPIVLIFAVILSLGAGNFAWKNEFDYDLRDLMGEDIQAFARYEECVRLFGPDDDIFVAFPLNDINEQAFADAVKTRLAISNLQGISKVVDLGNIHGIESLADLEFLASRPRMLQRTLEKVKENRLVKGVVVSPDYRAQILIVRTVPMLPKNKQELVRKIRDRLKYNFPEKKYYLAGYQVFAERYVSLMIGENTFFLGLSLATAVFLARFFLPSFLTTLAVTISVVLPTIWTQGAFSLLGNKISLYSTLLSPIILFVALSLAVQFVARCFWFRNLSQGNFPMDKILEKAVPPAILCTVTTGIGFGSQMFSEIRGVRAFGMLSSLGCGFAFMSVFLLLPGFWLRLSPRIKLENSRERFVGRWLSKNFPKPGTVFFACFILFIVAGYGFRHLKLGSDPLEAFPRDDEVVVAHKFISDRFGGGVRHLSVIFRNPKQPFDRLESMVDLKRVSEAIASCSNVGNVFSPVAIIQAVEEEISGGKKNFSTTDSGVKRAFRTAERLVPGLLKSVINPPFYDRSRMIVSLTVSDSIKVEEVARNLEEVCRNAKSPLLASITGRMDLSARMENHALRVEGFSFLFSLAGVLLVIGLAFGRVRHLLIGFLANFFPIFLSFGVLGWFHSSIDPSIAMVPCLCIGIIVDDTIHLLHELDLMEKAGHHGYFQRSAVFLRLGWAVISTSVILTFGLGLLGFSSFGPMRRFGGVSALTIFFALMFDLFLTPTLYSHYFFEKEERGIAKTQKTP